MKKIVVTLLLPFILSVACQAAPSALPQLVIPDGLGVNIHFAGTDMAQVNKIADAGFKFVRMDFAWNNVERKPGEFNFDIYDQLVDSLATRGIRVIYILDYGNPIYEGAAPPFTDESRAAFAAYAKAGAAHFKGRGVIWEIYNEPNGTWFWKDPNPRDYFKLAKVTYTAIKEADPDCLVIGPATCSGKADRYLEGVFELGLLNYVDAVSVHPYGCRPPEDANYFYTWLRRKISQYAPNGKKLPIISGEWGYPSLPCSSMGDGVTLEQQAEFLPRMFLINTMNGCPISIWYDWRNDGTGQNPGDREHNFGTLYFDYKEKPSYVAMKTLTSELKGYSFVRRISLGNVKDYAILMQKDCHYKAAVWTTGDTHAITIPVDSPSVAIVSLLGEKKLIDTRDGSIQLEINGSVQYIEPSTQSKNWGLDTSWNK